MSKHICGQGGEEFSTEKQYIEHTCAKTNKKPTNPDHLGRVFKMVSDKAVERGSKRKK